MSWRIIEYTKKFGIEFNPMERWTKKQMSWITTGLLALSCLFGTLAYKENSWWLLSIGWLIAFISGQFYFIAVNYDDLKKS